MPLKIAILDDYTNVALGSADWSKLPAGAELTVFDRHLNEEEAVRLLEPFDVLCTMRERMAFPRSLIERLPRLKLLLIIGMSLPNLDMAAATEKGIVVVHTDMRSPAYAGIGNATPELTWGLVIAVVRQIAAEDRHVRAGGWQQAKGYVLAGKTLGLLGLGRIGKRMAEYGKAFGMNVIAWSPNLTAEAAAAVGVKRVEKDDLFRTADIVSIHVVLSQRSRGLVGRHELGLMKQGAYLINTSRGPIVDEASLMETSRSGRLGGAGLDVFDQEPLPRDHPFRSMENVTITPHIGYNTIETMRAFYSDMPDAITAFAAGTPIRVANPDVLKR